MNFHSVVCSSGVVVVLIYIKVLLLLLLHIYIIYIYNNNIYYTIYITAHEKSQIKVYIYI